MILSVANNLDSLPTTPYSFLSANVNVGGTALGVKNINPFTANYAVQLGKTGESQSEILVISGAPANGTVNTSGTIVYPHSLDTPIYQIHYDKIIFKRSTVGTAGTAVAIGTTAITPNSQFTEYNDSTGTTTYAYKTQYQNSVSGDISIESDWFVPGGPTFYSLQAIRQRSKDALFNASYLKSDNVIDDWINEWVEIMTNSAIKVNQGYSMDTMSVNFDATGYGTITEPLFKTANKMEVSWDGGTTYITSTEIPINRFSEGDTYSGIYPKHFWQGDTTFGILPAGNAGIARITYSKLATRLVNDADNLPVSLRSYTTSCIEYILYKAFDNDLKRDYANDHYGKFAKSQMDFIHEVTPRDATGIKTIQFSESLSGGQDAVDLISDFLI